MRYLPIFLDLSQGPVVLAGSGEMAEAKLRLLLRAGGRVRWHGGTQEALDSLRLDADSTARVEMAGDPASAALDGVMAVLCAGAGDAGIALGGRARAMNIPVNVVDDLTHSSFIFPAIVDRDDVVVAIGTGGSAPVLARRLRERIEAMLPARIGELAAFIGRWRKKIHAGIAHQPLKRKFWERVVDGEIGDHVLAGRSAEAEAALAAIADPQAFASAYGAGFVTLVGAGPGDPDLLTVKALRALSDADVVLHDDLVSADILDRARRDAALIAVGRRRGKPGVGQDEIHRLMIEHAREGKRVVRLKGGDPFIYGRGGEEIEVLRGAGIAYSIVPGITAGMGAAAQSEVPLTFRHEAVRVAFLTAHRAVEAEAIDWAGFTDKETTLVVYMGIASAKHVREGLLEAGHDPLTPAAIFANATRADSRVYPGYLKDLPELAAHVGEGPAILIIGTVVARSQPWRVAQLPSVLSSLKGNA